VILVIFDYNLFIIAAEFIIHLAEENDTFETFKNILVENGAEFSVSKGKL
jgi:hypothetical protein